MSIAVGRKLGPSPSDAQVNALQYAPLLQRVMTMRKMTPGQVAAAAGITETMVRYYLRGRYIPSSVTAEKLALVLDSEGLVSKADELRFGACRMCGKTFQRGRTRRLYCSRACWYDRLKGVSVIPKVDPRQAAIDRMCLACEPEGKCRDGSCPLRPFSPLQLDRKATA